MLVLTRRVNESISIGDSIVVTVLAIEGDRIKLGITAPREIQILRQEVIQAIKEQEQLDAKPSKSPEPDSHQPPRSLLASNDDPGTADSPDPEI